jgi:hypothetical protein
MGIGIDLYAHAGVETWNLVVACIAATAALAGLAYQWRSVRRRQLVELADLLTELHAYTAGYGGVSNAVTTKARIRTRLGRRRDLPKTRALVDTPLHDDVESMRLVAEAITEVDAALGR